MADGVHIALEKLGIVGDHGAVVVVVTGALIDIVGQAGVEDGIHAALYELLDMAVHDLGGVAGCVRGDGELTLYVKVAGGGTREGDVEAQIGEQGVPHGSQLVHAQRHGDTDGASAAVAALLLQGGEAISLVLVEVGDDLSPFGELFTRAALALVARDEALAAREGVDGEVAVIAAAATGGGLGGMGEGGKLCGGHGGGALQPQRAGEQSRAKGAHESADIL